MLHFGTAIQAGLGETQHSALCTSLTAHSGTVDMEIQWQKSDKDWDPQRATAGENNVQHALPQQSHQLLFSSSSGRTDVWYSESIPDKPLRFYYATFYGIVLDKNGDLSNTMLLTL